AAVISAVLHRVNYSETDQMGFVYHANYLIWMDMARTEHLRERGMSYKQLEEQGTYLTVTDVHVRYRQPARYDDMIRVRCWVRDLASRRVIFGYAVERARGDGGAARMGLGGRRCAPLRSGGVAGRAGQQHSRRAPSGGARCRQDG